MGSSADTGSPQIHVQISPPQSIIDLVVCKHSVLGVNIDRFMCSLTSQQGRCWLESQTTGPGGISVWSSVRARALWAGEGHSTNMPSIQLSLRFELNYVWISVRNAAHSEPPNRKSKQKISLISGSVRNVLPRIYSPIVVATVLALAVTNTLDYI